MARYTARSLISGHLRPTSAYLLTHEPQQSDAGQVACEGEKAIKPKPRPKGTIRFQPADPLPATLVRKLVRARIAKNAAVYEPGR